MTAPTPDSTTPVTVFVVSADPESGEWLDDLSRTEETTTWADWHARTDTDAVHFDHLDADAQQLDTRGATVLGGMIPVRVEWNDARG